MDYLRKLPDSRRSPPGLERVILRKLPGALLAGTLIPLFCYAIAWLYPQAAGDSTVEKYLTTVGIAAIAAVITAWTAVFTVAIGCVVVVLMKGPAYVADRYNLIDADEPASGPRRDPPDPD
jgi:hypothetical protein